MRPAESLPLYSNDYFPLHTNLTSQTPSIQTSQRGSYREWTLQRNGGWGGIGSGHSNGVVALCVCVCVCECCVCVCVYMCVRVYSSRKEFFPPCLCTLYVLGCLHFQIIITIHHSLHSPSLPPPALPPLFLPRYPFSSSLLPPTSSERNLGPMWF